MHPQHEPTLIGGPLLDAANPDHNVQPAACYVCGTQRGLNRNNLPGPHGVTCLPHLGEAMRRLGRPSSDGLGLCTAPHNGYEPGSAYRVVEVWPLNTLNGPTVKGCAVHLTESLAALKAALTPSET